MLFSRSAFDCLVFVRLQAVVEKESGNAAYRKKDFAAAISHYDKAIQLDPSDMSFRTNKAGNSVSESLCLRALLDTVCRNVTSALFCTLP